ncbi:MAG: LysM peptidoglycan-binding domain-containing protein [Nitrospirota bacterium]|nr:LysM peptidoglycan-binding domain-containing protein [Nitrospirota bacterium]
MRHYRYYLGSILVMAFSLAAVLVHGEEGKHEVKKGDTLWDISNQHLGNPFQWPKVWKENPDIKNPDRIYPGQTIVLPGARTDDTATATPLQEPEKAVEVEVKPEPKKEVIALPEPPQPQLVAGVKTVLYGGFITPRDTRYNRVIGGQNDRAIYGTGDSILAETGRASIKPGDSFTIARVLRPVVHPVTKKSMGNLMTVQGVAVVSGVQKGVASLHVTDSQDAVMEDDLLIPHVEPKPLYKDFTRSSADRAQNGYVIEMKDEKEIAAEHDIVYIDRGGRDGVVLGDTFKVIREGDKITALRHEVPAFYPDEVVAEVTVIGVQEETATVLVSRSTSDIAKGFRFATR